MSGHWLSRIMGTDALSRRLATAPFEGEETPRRRGKPPNPPCVCEHRWGIHGIDEPHLCLEGRINRQPEDQEPCLCAGFVYANPEDAITGVTAPVGGAPE